MIKQDSYWYVEGDDEEGVIKALCTICAKKMNKGWYWSSANGYGDHDIFCSSCKNTIYLKPEGKDEVEAEADN